MALRFIDTRPFQRLHSIRQTGNCYRVFPSASHTRFSHSIGVYHVVKTWAQRFATELDADEGESVEHMAIAGLMHDVGHGPFSHLFEDCVRSQVDHTFSHEDMSIRILRYLFSQNVNSIADVVSPKALEFMVRCIKPPRSLARCWKYQIVSNQWSAIDADKLDYLQRDMHHMGIGSGIPLQRIIHTSTVDPVRRKMLYKPSTAPDLLEVFYQRFRMYRYIYQHHAVLKFDALVLDILKSVPNLATHLQSVEAYTQLDDTNILALSTDEAGKRRWYERNFPQDLTAEITEKKKSIHAALVGHILDGEPSLLERIEFTDGTRLSSFDSMHIECLRDINWRVY